MDLKDAVQTINVLIVLLIDLVLFIAESMKAVSSRICLIVNIQ